MNKALLALLTLSVSAFVACSAKIVDDDDSGLLSNRSSEIQTSSSVKKSSSIRKSSSQTIEYSEEASSSEDNPSSEARSSTRRSSSIQSTSSSRYSSSSNAVFNSDHLILSIEKVVAFDKTLHHILTQPWTYTCEGESTPQIETEQQIWLYWLESTTLYTSTNLASTCEVVDCSTEATDDLFPLYADDEWTGGSTILGTWNASSGDQIHISNDFLEKWVKVADLTDINTYFTNAIGTGSSAQLVNRSTIEVSHNGHTIQFAIGVSAKNDTLSEYRFIFREDLKECSTSMYFYPKGSEPSQCPSDSYLGIDECLATFETDVNTMEICDLDYLNDGECDDYCLNFDDANDCQTIGLFKKAPSKKIRKPLSKLRL